MWTDFIETVVLITFCVVAYILLFAVCVYAQAHTYSCPTGPTGPQGSDGPLGSVGPSAKTANSYIHTNPITTSLAAPFPSPKSQPIPSAGIPYKTLTTLNDNAVFSWNFMINLPSATAAEQLQIDFSILGAATKRPFRTTESSQVVSLGWKRPAVFPGQVFSITASVTRNSPNSIIVTAISGLQWNISGGNSENAIMSNVFCSDMDFTGEDIFFQPSVTIPTSSTEEFVTICSSVDVFKE